MRRYYLAGALEIIIVYLDCLNVIPAQYINTLKEIQEYLAQEEPNGD